MQKPQKNKILKENFHPHLKNSVYQVEPGFCCTCVCLAIECMYGRESLFPPQLWEYS